LIDGEELNMFPYQSFRSGSPTILPTTNIYLEIRILEEMVKERFNDMTGQKLLDHHLDYCSGEVSEDFL
jgi:hypothetical protein